MFSTSGGGGGGGGGISTLGDIMSTSGMFSSLEEYHEYIRWIPWVYWENVPHIEGIS